MPVTLQQVQPLVIHDTKRLVKIFLSHNGTISSTIPNDVLDNESQLNSIQLRDFSDTQVLNWYIWQKLKK